MVVKILLVRGLDARCEEEVFRLPIVL